MAESLPVTTTTAETSDILRAFDDAVARAKAASPAGATTEEILARLRTSMGGMLGTADASATAIYNWVVAAIRSATATVNAPDVAEVVGRIAAEFAALRDAVSIDALSAAWADVDADWTNLLKLAPQLPFDVIAWMLTQITGLTVSGDQIRTLATGSPTREDRVALGQILVTLYDETLPTAGVADGFYRREAGTEEWTNFKMLAGAAMRLQLAGMVLSWIGNKLPFGLGRGMEKVAELMNDAIALDDALEEVVQVPMQAVIQRGLEAYYNRAIKPADLSASEALRAEISGKLKPGELGKILDNAGYRDDIRQILRDNAASNLTESDLNDLYQWNLLSREEVKKRYRDNAFEEPDAELKTKLVEGTRRQKLREKIFELYGNLYRDGVATKQEVTPFLENYGYDADEVEMWFEVQELERRQRKWMSDATVLKLVMKDILTVSAAIDYLTLQGMTVNDATAYLTLAIAAEKEAEVKEMEREAKAAIAKLPKAVRDKCDDLLKPEDILSELLARLIGLIPGDLNLIPGAAKLKSYLECAIKAILTP